MTSAAKRITLTILTLAWVWVGIHHYNTQPVNDLTLILLTVDMGVVTILAAMALTVSGGARR